MVSVLVWFALAGDTPDPVAASPCSKELPCFVSNSTACFALVRRRSCWVHHGADGESIPCSQQEPCCADAHCWWRHAPEQGLDGNEWFTVRRARYQCTFISLCGLVGGLFFSDGGFFWHLNHFVALNVFLLLAVPHNWFYMFCIPYFPHPLPQSTIESWSSFARMIIPMVIGTVLGLGVPLVFGARWRERLVGNAEAAGGLRGAVPDAPAHWPAPLRIPASIETRMKSTLVAPEAFICPLSLDLMRQPAITPRGTTYDREALSRWVIPEGRYPAREAASPLRMDQLAPNLTVRNLIQAWLEEQE